MNPKKISIQDYTYLLPEEKIAGYPLADRDASKLLVFKEGSIQEDIYHNISTYLPANSLMVFNNTRVVEARLHFQKETGGIIEVFCLEPADNYPDVTTAMQQQGKVIWKCLIGGASKWKHGMILQKKVPHANQDIILTARIHSREADTFIIELKWDPHSYSFAEILHLAGAIPLPPYIKRNVEESDAERYQTIYARESGSVAAPTAGLHFTESMFRDLSQKGIDLSYLTLHVGAGTFKPVKSEEMGEHEMHAEFFEVDLPLLNKLLSGKQLIAVGTTTARTLETLYWLGVKAKMNPFILPGEIHLDQWEAYEMATDIEMEVALHSLRDWMTTNKMDKLVTKTKLLIVPGYKLRVTDILITNFHQPQSTLLLLVAAVAGKDWKKIYEYALAHDFRFLSYGDGCLIYSRERSQL